MQSSAFRLETGTTSAPRLSGPILAAANAEAAEADLTAFERGPWGERFRTIVAIWRHAWSHVIPFFAFPPVVRWVIYTTNYIESVHARLRKIMKTRGHLPDDDAATKLIWLALRNITSDWSRAAHDWKQAMTQIAILYAERFTTARDYNEIDFTTAPHALALHREQRAAPWKSLNASHAEFQTLPRKPTLMADSRFLYFAYGSNMSSKRLTAQDRAPTAEFICAGFVAGYRLTFYKMSKDGSGKCDCEYTGDEQHRIYGVLFSVSTLDKHGLDRAEGKGFGYDEKYVDVITAQDVMRAQTYVATRKSSDLKPYHWYKQHVLDGAREGRLPPDYIAMLQAVEAIEDPDNERSARELRR